MNLTSIWLWIKANILLSAGILIVVVILFFPKVLSGLFRTRRRIRHRQPVMRVVHHRRNRTLPRSVGMYKVRKQYNKSGTAKKPWQIKGSEAARRHMAKIRRMR
jgi:hypothetical protein